MADHGVSIVAFSTSSADDMARGLIGWLSLRVGRIVLDGIAVRRTRDGRISLSYPERADRHGDRHPYIRPVDECARREIELQVLDALGYQREMAP